MKQICFSRSQRDFLSGIDPNPGTNRYLRVINHQSIVARCAGFAALLPQKERKERRCNHDCPAKGRSRGDNQAIY
jgi:hypothetical protein